MSGTGAVETWRGGVNTWDCDGMGHMNVRFYVARAQEALAGLALQLGQPRAFTESATATLLVRQHHVRFLKEARAGESLHMTCGVVEMGEADALVLQLLVHTDSGQPCATFLTRVVHATPGDGRRFPWPDRARDAAERLRVAIPVYAAPRSVSPVARCDASLAQADALGLSRIAAGAVTVQECDVFGRMGLDRIMGRISDGVGLLTGELRRAIQAASGVARIGGAALEYRLSYADMPRAGDHVLIRSGVIAFEPKVQRLGHWILDPVTGRAWATAEAVVASFDLDARRVITLPPEVQREFGSRTTPGLSA